MSNMKKPSFWEKPEGTAGMVFLGVLGVGAVALLGAFLPFIIALLSNLLVAIGLGVTLLVVVTALMNPNFRQLGGFLFRKAMRALANLFVNVYPLDVLAEFLRQWREKLERVKQGLAGVKAELKRIINELNQNGDKINELKGEFRLAKQRAEQFREAGNSSAEREQRAIMASRAQMVRMAMDQRKSYEQMYEQTRKAYRSLERIFHVLKHKVEVEEFNFETKSAQWENAKRNRSIVRDATSILRGINESELYDAANARIEEEMYLAEAEIEMLDEFTFDLQRSLEARDFMAVERLTREIEEAAGSLSSSEVGFDMIEMIPDVDSATDDIEPIDTAEFAFEEEVEYAEVERY